MESMADEISRLKSDLAEANKRIQHYHDTENQVIRERTKERDSALTRLAVAEGAQLTLKAEVDRLRKAYELALYYIEGDATYEGVKAKCEEILKLDASPEKREK